MSWTCDVLHQKRWWLAHIQQENVHVAVISYISKSGTPPARQRKRGEPCCGGSFFQCALSLFLRQKQTLPTSPAVIFNIIPLRINISALHNKKHPGTSIQHHKT